MGIDPTPLSAATALRADLLDQLRNGAQASQQASQRKAVAQIAKTAESAPDARSVASYRGSRLNIVA